MTEFTLHYLSFQDNYVDTEMYPLRMVSQIKHYITSYKLHYKSELSLDSQIDIASQKTVAVFRFTTIECSGRFPMPTKNKHKASNSIPPKNTYNSTELKVPLHISTKN